MSDAGRPNQEMARAFYGDSGDSAVSRMVLICKPEQSGKTFVMLEEIKNSIASPPYDKPIINFVFCDNNLLLTLQTSKRFKDVRVSDTGESYLEFSSHARTKYNSAEAVHGGICMNKVYNVLCCTNGKRVLDIEKLITSLSGQYAFKIWLDEADKYLKAIKDTFKPLVEKYGDVSLYCITATPSKLFAEFGEFNVFPLMNTTSEHYHGWNDNILNLYSLPSGTVEFADHVLRHNPEYIVPGTKWFIPADYKKSSHQAMAEMCGKHGIATIIVNGDGIECILPDRRTKRIKKTDELNKLLLGLYRDEDLKLSDYSVAITGYLCVGRGISIMSNDFMFDYGILSATHNPQEASQNAGRLKGNIKEFPNYKAPIVFTTPKFNEIATEWEEKSRSLAKIAFAKQSAGESTVITDEEFKGIGQMHGSGSGAEPQIEHRVYENFEDVKVACKFMGHNAPIQRKRNAAGFRMTSLNSKSSVVSLSDAISKVSSGYGGSSQGKSWRTYYPCYRDVTDKTTLRYVFIIRPESVGKLSQLDETVKPL